MAATPGPPAGTGVAHDAGGTDGAAPVAAPAVVQLSYHQFALDLLNHAVTPDRVAAVITSIAGERVTVGPLQVGPGGAASATGIATIGPVVVRSVEGHQIGFEATIAGELTLEVGVLGQQYRYDGDVSVPLRISVQLAEPVALLLVIAAVKPSDVTVRLRTSGLAAFVLQTLGDANREIAGQVTGIVNQRARSIDDLCRIEVGRLLDQAWDSELQGRLADRQPPS